MKHFDSWDDLVEYGVNFLTGEACGLSMRILLDLNEAGVKLVTEFFGGCEPTKDNWNSQVDGKPAVKSVMLCRDTINKLLEFAVRRDRRFEWVWIRDSGKLVGVENKQERKRLDVFKTTTEVGGQKWTGLPGRVVRGAMPSRNRHEMSGRVA